MTNTINIITIQTAFLLNTPGLYMKPKQSTFPYVLQWLLLIKIKNPIYKRKRYISPVTRQKILRILSSFVFYEKNTI